VAYLAAAALLIGVNWGVYIWSVGSGHVVDASMGYFINPLVSVLLGVAVLKERLAPAEFAALALAAFGVSYLGISHGAFPWIALVLAATFGLYGLIKKLAGADALAGLFVESCVLAPVALAFLAGKQMAGTAALRAAPLYRSGPLRAVRRPDRPAPPLVRPGLPDCRALHDGFL
jgi:chloramphenicol-sensitive protein RarD